MAHGHQDQSQVEEACLNAFRTKSGDEVLKLLPLLSEPTTITTTIYKYGMSFQFIRQPQHKPENELEQVSLSCVLGLGKNCKRSSVCVQV